MLLERQHMDASPTNQPAERYFLVTPPWNLEPGTLSCSSRWEKGLIFKRAATFRMAHLAWH